MTLIKCIKGEEKKMIVIWPLLKWELNKGKIENEYPISNPKKCQGPTSIIIVELVCSGIYMTSVPPYAM